MFQLEEGRPQPAKKDGRELKFVFPSEESVKKAIEKYLDIFKVGHPKQFDKNKVEKLNMHPIFWLGNLLSFMIEDFKTAQEEKKLDENYTRPRGEIDIFAKIDEHESQLNFNLEPIQTQTADQQSESPEQLQRESLKKERNERLCRWLYSLYEHFHAELGEEAKLPNNKTTLNPDRKYKYEELFNEKSVLPVFYEDDRKIIENWVGKITQEASLQKVLKECEQDLGKGYAHGMIEGKLGTAIKRFFDTGTEVVYGQEQPVHEILSEERVRLPARSFFEIPTGKDYDHDDFVKLLVKKIIFDLLP